MALSTRTLFIFPLEITILEEEELRLHIFEPRYKKLIQLCLDEQIHFGIPTIYQGKFTGNGAEMQLLKIEKTYENGEMDIICRAVSRFEISEILESEDRDTASSALINELPFIANHDKELNLRLFDLLEELYHLANAESGHQIDSKDNIFRYFHKCGLGPEKEQETAILQSAAERQLYLLNHLKNLVVTLSEVNKMKQLVKLNGHFRKLSQSF